MALFHVKGTDSRGKDVYWCSTGGWAGKESAGAFPEREAHAIIFDQKIRNRNLDSDERVDPALEKAK